jgi:hypothetical protein
MKAPKMKILASVAIFCVAMLTMTIVCTILWDDYLNGTVYACSDGGDWEYLILDWSTIGNGNFPAVVVPRIHDLTSMNDPDELKEGWSVARLWSVWYSFLGGSIAVSLLAAGFPWWQGWCPKPANPKDAMPGLP